MKRRSLLFILLFAAFPCFGIFSVLYKCYWIWAIQEDIRRVRKNAPTGMMTLLLMLLSCGLYGLYWQWTVCDFLRYDTGEDTRLITLVLSFFGVGIWVNPLIIQGQINRALAPLNRGRSGSASYESPRREESPALSPAVEAAFEEAGVEEPTSEERPADIPRESKTIIR